MTYIAFYREGPAKLRALKKLKSSWLLFSHGVFIVYEEKVEESFKKVSKIVKNPTYNKCTGVPLLFLQVFQIWQK